VIPLDYLDRIIGVADEVGVVGFAAGRVPKRQGALWLPIEERYLTAVLCRLDGKARRQCGLAHAALQSDYSDCAKRHI
jgi:hypothetical protein